MLRKVLTCIILVLMYPYVSCNIVQLHNSLVVSYSLFQVFTDIHDIQIGYPIINEYGSICQTPPFTYKSLPIGVVPEMLGTLRNLNGSAVGLWYNAKNCYVVPFSHNDTCTEYSFSNRLSECDNDIRLQLNTGKAGFRMIQDLHDIRLLLEKLLDSFYQIQALEKRSITLSGAPKTALSQQIHNLINNFLVQSGTYMDKIDTYVLQDLKYIDGLQLDELYHNTHALTQSVEKGSALLRLLTGGSFNQSDVDEMAQHLVYYSNFHSKNAEIMLWQTKLQLKRVAYHSTVVSMSNLIHQVHAYRQKKDTCQSVECETQLPRDLLEFNILDTLRNITQSNLERKICIQSIIERAMGEVEKILGSQSKYIDIDYSLPYQWNRCLSGQTLSQHRNFSLDLSGMLIPYAMTTSVFSDQGSIGSLFLPHASIVAVYHEMFTLAINFSRLSATPLIETNSELTETTYSPAPQPIIIPPASETPLFKCPPGRYGENCIDCPVGTWSNDGYLHLCSNAPDADAVYFVATWPTPDCPFRCLNNRYRVNNSCLVPPDGYYPLSNQYEIGKCRTEYPSKFISHLSHGLTGRPYSCPTEVHHLLEFEYSMTNLLGESFSMEVWMKVDSHDLQRACDRLCDQVRFGVLDSGKWSTYLSMHDSMVTLSVTDHTGASARSNPFNLDGNWHHYVVQYDSVLKLMYFSIDSTPLGGGWYNSPKSIDNDKTLIIGGIRSDYPWRTRVLPGLIAKIRIYSQVFPMEAFLMNLNSVSKQCDDGQYWINHKCISLCRSETRNNDCSCIWGQFYNNQTSKCSWCPGITIGSKFPYYSESDCICDSGYIWSNSVHSCVLGKPPLVDPEVEFLYDPIPEVIDNTEGIVIPLNATMVVSLPSQNSAIQSLRKISESTNDVALDITVLSGLAVVMTEHILFNNLPFRYTFLDIGHYRIDAWLNKPGHLLGVKYSQSVVVQTRALPPFILPFDRRLNGTSLFKIATQEPSENHIYYSFDGMSYNIYDKLNPPVASPPVSIYMFTKSLKPNMLPSPLITTNFIWNTESENYKLFMNDKSTTSERNTTESSTPVAFLVWCQKSVPNCILVFVIPVGSLIVIILGIILALIVARIFVKRKRRQEKRKNSVFGPIEEKKTRHKKGDKKGTLIETVHSGYGDIICDVNSCKKLAQYHCLNCRQYLCNHCRTNHPIDHEWTRIMICDSCRRKSKKLTVFQPKTKSVCKYVCHRCVSHVSFVSSPAGVIRACIQCKDEQICSKESQYLCKNCIILSKLYAPFK